MAFRNSCATSSASSRLFVIHSQTIVLSTRFAATKGFGALNYTTGTCKTAANHVDHASGGNQRPTGSHGTECGANALDAMSEPGQFERRERTTLIRSDQSLRFKDSKNDLASHCRRMVSRRNGSGSKYFDFRRKITPVSRTPEVAWTPWISHTRSRTSRVSGIRHMVSKFWTVGI